MELHARLVHAEAGLRVVEVRASHGEHSLGSTLAEAATAQEAEDLAVSRLLRRLEGTGPIAAVQGGAAGPMAAPQASRSTASRAESAPAAAPGSADNGSGATLRPRPVVRPAAAATAGGEGRSGQSDTDPSNVHGQPPAQAELALAATAAADRGPGEASLQPPRAASNAPQRDPQEEPPADPEDWSQELTAVDLQLRRLGWSREQEGTYLQRAFGHPSRSRLTRYSDLRAYLMALEGLQVGGDPALAPVPLRRSELLAQGDALLRQLGWTAEQDRAFLERHLERISRQQLSDVQLLEFNMLLEGELLAGDTAAAMADPDGAQR